MRKLLVLFFCILFVGSAFSLEPSVKQRYKEGQLIVKFKPNVIELPQATRIASAARTTIRPASVRMLTKKFKMNQVRQMISKKDRYVLEFDKDQDLEQIMQELRKDPNVEAVSKNSILRIFETIPNDPYYVDGSQYAITNLKCTQAWDFTTGTSETKIAVLDTGIRKDHPDLLGKIDTANAWNFVNNSDNPYDDNTDTHGTRAAGCIAANTNNGIGIAGINWQAKILPIKVMNGVGQGTMSDILDGIYYAISKNAQVINMSFGQYSADPLLEEACQSAYEAGIVLIAAAGNGNVSWPSYPAYYSSVLAVAAVDSSDKRSYWGGIDPDTVKPQASNYGTWVDVAAPGTDVYATCRNSEYIASNGTSFSSPIVAGVAGLLKAGFPNYTNQQIMFLITSEADNIDSLNPGFEGLLGSGRVNALRCMLVPQASITTPAANAYVKGSVSIIGNAYGNHFANYVLEAWQNSTFVATIEASSTSVLNGSLGIWDTSSYNGQYSVKLKVFFLFNNTTEASVALNIDNATPEAKITSPLAGVVITGEVAITGKAIDPYYFDYYALQYGSGANPATFETIGTFYTSVESNTLGNWQTTGLNGVYTLKIISYNKAGTISTEAITIYLSNTSSPTKEVDPEPGLPLTYPLPNPFDRAIYSQITFNYTLAGNFGTKIYVFDLNGNMVWQASYSAGENGGKFGANDPAWDGKNKAGTAVEDGVYLYQIISDNKPLARGKLIVLN